MHLSIVKVGLFLGAIVLLTGTQKVNALTVDELLATNSEVISSSSLVDESNKAESQNYNKDYQTLDSQKPAQTVSESVEIKVVEPTIHTVESGESLTKVAEKYQTTWTRLYDKNTQIFDPNIINTNDLITIPATEEQLVARELPKVELVAPAVISNPVLPAKKSESTSASNSARGNSSGNLYITGYCTWYVKNRRPDMPNNLGNASTWVARARAQGMPTGSAPRAGAVGQKGNHVVYVESVNSDGTVNVSEMNREGWNVKSSRTVPASFFQYIY